MLIVIQPVDHFTGLILDCSYSFGSRPMVASWYYTIQSCQFFLIYQYACHGFSFICHLMMLSSFGRPLCVCMRAYVQLSVQYQTFV